MNGLAYLLLSSRNGGDTSMGELMAIILVPFGLWCAYMWFTSETRTAKRALRAAPSYTIAELPEKTSGRVMGTVRPHLDKTLIAPITGRPCVAYQAFVWRVTGVTAASKSPNWDLIAFELQSVPFEIVDATGTAIVDPTGARLVLDNDGGALTGMLHGAPSETQLALLARHKQGPSSAATKYKESIIGIGEDVAVLGVGTRDPATKQLRFRATKAAALTITDDRKAAHVAHPAA